MLRRLYSTVEATAQSAQLARFWKDAGGLAITLDGKPLKTPAGHEVILPSIRKPLAHFVVSEWQGQPKTVRAHSFPVTSLVVRAIDSFGMSSIASGTLSEEALEEFENERKHVIDGLVKYLHTDAVCYRQDYPESFVTLQKAHWDPLVSWIQEAYGVSIKTTESITGVKQDPETIRILGDRVHRMSSLELAGFERAVHMTKSFILSLALLDRHISVQEATEAARVEVMHQTNKWGECEDAHDVAREDLTRNLGSVITALL